MIWADIRRGRKVPRARRWHAVHQWASSLTPAAGAAVMSTGVLSIAWEIDGLELLSQALLGLAVAGELLLGAVFTVRLLVRPTQWRSEAATPASLTAVATTAVIGARLALLGWDPAAWLLLTVGTLLWAVLLPLAFRHWAVLTVGTSFLVCVATQGLAVLAGTLGPAAGSRWIVLAGFVVLLLGVALYAIVFSVLRLATAGGRGRRPMGTQRRSGDHQLGRRQAGVSQPAATPIGRSTDRSANC